MVPLSARTAVFKNEPSLGEPRGNTAKLNTNIPYFVYRIILHTIYSLMNSNTAPLPLNFKPTILRQGPIQGFYPFFLALFANSGLHIFFKRDPVPRGFFFFHFQNFMDFCRLKEKTIYFFLLPQPSCAIFVAFSFMIIAIFFNMLFHSARILPFPKSRLYKKPASKISS